MRILKLLPTVAIVLLVCTLLLGTITPSGKVHCRGLKLGRADRLCRVMAILAVLQMALVARLRRVGGRALRRVDAACARRSVVWILALALAALFAWGKVTQHRAIETHAGDLALFDLAVSNTLRGAYMYTPMPSDARGCMFAVHYYGILHLLLPLYFIWDSPYALLVFQGVVVALAIVPLWYYARSEIGEPFVAALLGLSFVTSRYMTDGLFFDFHPEMAVPLFLLSCFACYSRRCLAWYAFFALLAALCREDVAVYLIGWGLYIALVRKDYKVGAATVVLSFLYAFIAVRVLIPLFSPPCEEVAKLLAERYQAYGTSVPSIVWGMLTHPLTVVSDLARRASFMLLLSVLFLPLASPSSLLLLGPPLVAAMTSSTSGMSSLRLYASAPILPFLYVGAIAGLVTICKRWPQRRKVLLWSACLAIFALNAGHWHWHRVTPRDRMVARLVATIPTDASVTASYDLVPHLPRRSESHLRQVFVLGDGGSAGRKVDYVLIDMNGNPFPMDKEPLNRLATEYRARAHYEIAHEEDGLLILRRGGRTSRSVLGGTPDAFRP